MEAKGAKVAGGGSIKRTAHCRVAILPPCGWQKLDRAGPGPWQVAAVAERQGKGESES